MASTITRDQVYQIMGDQVGPAVVPMLDEALARLGWETKPEFGQAEFVSLMAGIAQLGRELVVRPDSPASESDQQHVSALLDVFEQHTVPVLLAHAQ